MPNFTLMSYGICALPSVPTLIGVFVIVIADIGNV